MYRWFLSWRYLVTRPTNFIGIVGISVAVGALILILSIMTGFLVETRTLLRGGLADLIVTPLLYSQGQRGERVPHEPHALLAHLRADPRVLAATPRLTWFGLAAGAGENAAQTSRVLQDARAQGLNAVQLIGVDVAPDVEFTYLGLRTFLALHGLQWTPPRVQDEFDTTDLEAELRREPHPLRLGEPVADARVPFALPPNFEPRGRRPATAVIGEQLASQLNLRRGDTLKLLTVVPDPYTGDLATSDRDYLVAGTFRTGDNQLDIGRVYLDRTELWDLLGRQHSYSEILVRLRDYERDGKALQADLVRDLQAATLIVPIGSFPSRTALDQVRTWEDFRQVMLGAVENERVLLGIMLSLVLLVAGFTIFAILTMMVAEKRRDIGILAAVGAPPRGILLTFLTIGFWNAFLGTTCGAVLGVLGAKYINDIEIWLSRQFDVVIFNRDVYAFDTIPAVIDPLAVAAIVAGAFTSTLLFAAIPAWRAARMDPLVALRYE
jgi:lipoprotein-releasing system permease protein